MTNWLPSIFPGSLFIANGTTPSNLKYYDHLICGKALRSSYYCERSEATPARISSNALIGSLPCHCGRCSVSLRRHRSSARRERCRAGRSLRSTPRGRPRTCPGRCRSTAGSSGCADLGRSHGSRWSRRSQEPHSPVEGDRRCASSRTALAKASGASWGRPWPALCTWWCTRTR